MNNRELIVFHLYKDYTFLSSKEFQRKVENLDIDTTKVYAEISKYQVKKYGHMLNARTAGFYNEKSEYKKNKMRRKKRFPKNQKERVWTESEFLRLNDE